MHMAFTGVPLSYDCCNAQKTKLKWSHYSSIFFPVPVGFVFPQTECLKELEKNVSDGLFGADVGNCKAQLKYRNSSPTSYMYSAYPDCTSSLGSPGATALGGRWCLQDQVVSTVLKLRKGWAHPAPCDLAEGDKLCSREFTSFLSGLVFFSSKERYLSHQATLRIYWLFDIAKI